MKKSIICSLVLASFAPSGFAQGIYSGMVLNTPESQLISGVNLANRNLNVRAQDDFYQYANGGWLKTAQIPADKAQWGAFNQLRESSLVQLHGIMNQLIVDKHLPDNSNQQKLVDLYQSYMDESALNQLGAKPLQGLLAQVSQLQNKSQIAGLMAKLAIDGVATPYELAIHQDARDSSIMVADLAQSGLGLPDRDYYLKHDDKNMQHALAEYRKYVAAMLSQLGDKNAALEATQIVDLETKLAQLQWTKVANRDPVKTYNKYPLAKLNQLAPNYAWNDYLAAANLQGKVTYLVISQPSFISGFNQLLKDVPLATWQAYFRWQVLNSFAPYLSAEFAEQHFAFYGTVLSGVPQNKPRWQRGLVVVENNLGEALGELYVAKYFPPQNKAKMEQLVANLMTAYRQSIESLEWMSPATKVKAQEKLAAIMLKIGYPEHWRDYSGLIIKPQQLINNLQAAAQFEYQRNINKLGKPVDRAEWGMTPQTVNAYYNPELNEIVFPAAILQAPFFDVNADAAVNYGGIGAVIGHEISHGFDDQGSQYDATGNLHDWFTAEDHAKFAAKTSALVAQYNQYTPIAGYHVNGELTLGENIADNAGLDIAYKAYKISLNGKTAPVIDGYSGEQRLYLGWAEVWRAKVREAQQIMSLKTDPHSPASVRGNAPLRNQPGFYAAYKVESSDQMYLPPAKRVTIW